MKLKSYFVSCILLCILAACNSRVIFEDNIKIPEYKWEINNVLRLETEISDTLSAYNIYINLRHASGYPFSNIFLFVKTTSPDGSSVKDTLELTLADETGKWLGSGMGDIWDNRVLFKKNYRFNQPGAWAFDIQQAMRINPLPQVMDAGLRIERVDLN